MLHGGDPLSSRGDGKVETENEFMGLGQALIQVERAGFLRWIQTETDASLGDGDGVWELLPKGSNAHRYPWLAERR